MKIPGCLTTRLRLSSLAVILFLFIDRSQCCNQTAVEACVMGVRQDFISYCGRHDLAESKVYACQVSSDCTNPTTDPDFGDALSEIKLACKLYMPCGQYYSCIGKLVGIDYRKVLMNDPMESDMAGSLSSRVCMNRTSFKFDGWPDCVKANPACILEIETIIGGDNMDVFINMDSGFTEVLNRFDTAKRINTFLDHFCMPECDSVLEKVFQISLCADWEKLSKDINHKNAQNHDITQDCQQLSTGLKCLKTESQSCQPTLEYFHEFTDDLARAKPGAYLKHAASFCGLEVPKPTYNSNSAGHLMAWLSLSLWSVIIVFMTV